MIECLRCNRVELAQDAAWLTATITCETLTDTVSLCPDCQRTLYWTPRQLIAFLFRQAASAMTLTLEGVR